MDDVLLEKIKEYRRMLKLDKPDLDVRLLMKIFDITNESSEVFVSYEPVDENGDWIAGSPKYAVCGLKKLEDGKLALKVNQEKHGIAAGELYKQYAKALKNGTGTNMPVLFIKSDETVQLTEAFSHAIVNQQWAGLPFDIILGVRKRPIAAADPESEDGPRS